MGLINKTIFVMNKTFFVSSCSVFWILVNYVVSFDMTLLNLLISNCSQSDPVLDQSYDGLRFLNIISYMVVHGQNGLVKLDCKD